MLYLIQNATTLIQMASIRSPERQAFTKWEAEKATATKFMRQEIVFAHLGKIGWLRLFLVPQIGFFPAVVTAVPSPRRHLVVGVAAAAVAAMMAYTIFNRNCSATEWGCW